MKRIILEGMDSSGKTTLIKTITDNFHFLVPVVNELGPEQDFNAWLSLQIWDSGLDAPHVPIHDRFFYSEIVYGQVLRHSVNIDRHIRVTVAEHLRQNAFLIYCRPSTHMMWKTLNNNVQMKGVQDNFAALLGDYDLTMTEEQQLYGDDRFVRYDWTGDSIVGLLNQLDHYLLDR